MTPEAALGVGLLLLTAVNVGIAWVVLVRARRADFRLELYRRRLECAERIVGLATEFLYELLTSRDTGRLREIHRRETVEIGRALALLPSALAETVEQTFDEHLTTINDPKAIPDGYALVRLSDAIRAEIGVDPLGAELSRLLQSKR